MKKCSRCKQYKTKNEFSVDLRTPTGLNAYCRPCRQFTGKRYRQKNKKLVAQGIRRCLYKSKYDITVQQYQKMFKQQLGACAICNKQNLNGKHLDVDHCHKTGKVRGLLCSNCNRGIGHLQQDIQIFKKAMQYLAGGVYHPE